LVGATAITNIWVAEPGTSPTTTRGYAGIQYSWTSTDSGIFNSQVDNDYFDSDVLQANVVPPGENSTIYTIQLQLNAMTHAGLVTDGIAWSLLSSKIKQFEQIVDITVDGIFGPQCVSATAQIYAKSLCGLTYQELIPTRLIQFRMGISIDGIFEINTTNSVKS